MGPSPPARPLASRCRVLRALLLCHQRGGAGADAPGHIQVRAAVLGRPGNRGATPSLPLPSLCGLDPAFTLALVPPPAPGAQGAPGQDSRWMDSGHVTCDAPPGPGAIWQGGPGGPESGRGSGRDAAQPRTRHSPPCPPQGSARFLLPLCFPSGSGHFLPEPPSSWMAGACLCDLELPQELAGPGPGYSGDLLNWCPFGSSLSPRERGSRWIAQLGRPRW